MARIQEEILDAFYAKLSASENTGPAVVEELRKLFASGEELKHSEGHQDGMGACLYFALMKKLLGDRFGFAVLDDVVMEVTFTLIGDVFTRGGSQETRRMTAFTSRTLHIATHMPQTRSRRENMRIKF